MHGGRGSFVLPKHCFSISVFVLAEIQWRQDVQYETQALSSVERESAGFQLKLRLLPTALKIGMWLEKRRFPAPRLEGGLLTKAVPLLVVVG